MGCPSCGLPEEVHPRICANRTKKHSDAEALRFAAEWIAGQCNPSDDRNAVLAELLDEANRLEAADRNNAKPEDGGRR